jgi:hypothetical protein
MAEQRYRHPALGFELVLRAGAEIHDDMPHVALLVLEPAPPEEVSRANVTVTADRLGDERDVERVTDAALAVQERALRSFHLIDRCGNPVAGRPGTRTLAHHDMEGIPVTLEQWRVVSGELAYTLSASCATWSYHEYADLAAATAESLRLAG